MFFNNPKSPILIALILMQVLVHPSLCRSQAFQFDAPRVLGEYEARDGHQPRIATDGKGNWVGVWVAETSGTMANIYYSRSADNATTWSSPSPLTSPDPHYHQADVATDRKGRWIAFWSRHGNDGGGAANDMLMARRSTDDGITWSPEMKIVDMGYGLSMGMAADGNGNWNAVWIGANSQVYSARSEDNGSTWSQPVKISNCTKIPKRYSRLECSDPQIAVDEAGHWIAVWAARGVPTPTPDVSPTPTPLPPDICPPPYALQMSHSDDGGRTWSDQGEFVEEFNQTFEVPMQSISPCILSKGSGHWSQAWVTEMGDPMTASYYTSAFRSSYSTDNGQNWFVSKPLLFFSTISPEPKMAYDGKGTIFAYWGARGGSDISHSITGAVSINTNAWLPVYGIEFMKYGPEIEFGNGKWVAMWSQWFPAPEGEEKIVEKIFWSTGTFDPSTIKTAKAREGSWVLFN